MRKFKCLYLILKFLHQNFNSSMTRFSNTHIENNWYNIHWAFRHVTNTAFNDVSKAFVRQTTGSSASLSTSRNNSIENQLHTESDSATTMDPWEQLNQSHSSHSPPPVGATLTSRLLEPLRMRTDTTRLRACAVTRSPRRL